MNQTSQNTSAAGSGVALPVPLLARPSGQAGVAGGAPGEEVIAPQAGVQYLSQPFTSEQLQALRTDAEQVIARYPQSRSALLPLLYLVQSVQGYVSADGIAFCAQMLGITTAQVTGVASFYTMFRRKPCGKYSVGVCTNTLCGVLGGDAIYARLREHLGLPPKPVAEVTSAGEIPARGTQLHHPEPEVSADGQVSLEQLECNAACDYAPVVMVNWEFFDNQTPDSAVALVDALLDDNPPQPTRGAPLTSFTETSRLLAGFYDGRADEGPSAGQASLAGLRASRGELPESEAWSGDLVADGHLEVDAAAEAGQSGSAGLEAEPRPAEPNSAQPDASEPGQSESGQSGLDQSAQSNAAALAVTASSPSETQVAPAATAQTISAPSDQPEVDVDYLDTGSHRLQMRAHKAQQAAQAGLLPHEQAQQLASPQATTPQSPLTSPAQTQTAGQQSTATGSAAPSATDDDDEELI